MTNSADIIVGNSWGNRMAAKRDHFHSAAQTDKHTNKDMLHTTTFPNSGLKAHNSICIFNIKIRKHR